MVRRRLDSLLTKRVLVASRGLGFQASNLLAVDGRPERLTPLESHALELFSIGMGRAEIAKRLNRSPKTISNSLTVAKEKLGAQSLAQAAILYVQAVLLVKTVNH